jgi:membrane protease YdiL (CAAX protease family)
VAVIKKHPVLFYYLLAFAISWGGLYIGSGGPAGFPDSKAQFEQMLPFFIPTLLAGPSLAGLLMTALVDGRAGFRRLFLRLFHWRVGARWYAVALLSGPLVLLTVLLALSQFSPGFLPGIFTVPQPASTLIAGVIAGLIVGLCEELGWTGFAVPHLRQSYSPLAVGLITGVLWGAWHIFLNVIWVSQAYTGGMPPAIFLALRGLGDLIGLLPAFRVLMVWVYEHTGSLLIAILMHAGLTAATMVLEPAGISGQALVIYDAASAALMWAVVAAVMLAQRKPAAYGLPA